MLLVTMMEIPPPLGPVAEDVASAQELLIACALEECLEAMDRGETDLDSISALYPGRESEIRTLLEIAQRLRRCRLSVPLSPVFREELRELLLGSGPS
jgi:hypothetical protein